MIADAPYLFAGPYARCYANRDMAMDERHVFMLYSMLTERTWKNALELGSFCGASSTAFIEAVNQGTIGQATFCDFDLREPLLDVLGNCLYPDRIRLTKEPSWNVLESPEDFDFILVDANHDLESVTKELDRLLIRKPLCVMAHDTNAMRMGYRKCDGAHHLKRTFQQHPDYYCIEDAASRKGEQTERGLFLATTSPDLSRLAREVFRVWS